MRLRYLLFAIILLVLVSYGCSQSEQKSDGKIRIVTTTYPLYEFAKEIVRDKAEVSLLIPAGAEPHNFEPKPSDISRLRNADIFVFTSENFETWKNDLLEGVDNKKLITIDASKFSDLIKNDPHLWLDFENDQKIVNGIASALVKMDSANSDFYLGNAENYKKKLESLDEKFSSGLKNCRQKKFITNHDAFGYLARRYNIEQIPVYGISPETEPSPKKVKEIVDVLAQNKIKYIFFEELLNPKVTETIAKEAGAGVLILNDAPNLTPKQIQEGKSFISVMEENLANLKKGLECT